MAVPLVALNARVELTSAKGERELALEKFFISPEQDVLRESVIKPDELITQVIVPASGARTAYYKQGEKESFDWPIADVAVALNMQAGRCDKAAVVLGAAAPYPYRAKGAEAQLCGAPISEDSARAAAKAAMANATPLAKNAYKIPIFEAIIRRTILRAAGVNTQGAGA
jgi:xanthine dehydrogenase YagS FAD-binding subunit